jgi:hypothetical protein
MVNIKILITVTVLVRGMVQILTNVKNIVIFSNTISNIDLIDTVKNRDLVIIMEDMALKMAVDMDFNTIIHLKGVLTIDKMKDRVLNTEIAMMDEVLTINEKETYQINMVKVREVLSMVALLHTAVVTVHPNRVDINMVPHLDMEDGHKIMEAVNHIQTTMEKVASSNMEIQALKVEEQDARETKRVSTLVDTIMEIVVETLDMDMVIKTQNQSLKPKEKVIHNGKRNTRLLIQSNLRNYKAEALFQALYNHLNNHHHSNNIHIQHHSSNIQIHRHSNLNIQLQSKNHNTQHLSNILNTQHHNNILNIHHLSSNPNIPLLSNVRLIILLNTLHSPNKTSINNRLKIIDNKHGVNLINNISNSLLLNDLVGNCCHMQSGKRRSKVQ